MDEQESEQAGRGGNPPADGEHGPPEPHESKKPSEPTAAEESEEVEEAGEPEQSGEPEESDKTSASDRTSASDGEGTGDPVGRKKAGEETRAAASQVHHNNVNQYFLGALDAPEIHFGIGVADSANARRRAVGRLDAGEADAVIASYVEPDCFEEAVTALQRDGVVVLVGPPGTGKRAAAVALVATVAEGSEYVVLSPGRSLEELANGRVEFARGVGYVLLDRMHENPSATADFDWRRVRDTVREHGAHLVVTTVHGVQGRALESVRHVPWETPDLAAVLRVRLTRTECEPETIERAVELMPAGCRIAEVVAAADRIGRGAEPDMVWTEYGNSAAAPVRDWFAEERLPQEWAEVTTLAFINGAGYRDFETCQQHLEHRVARAFPEPADEEAALAAARRAADRRLSLTRNSLVAVEERKDGALTRAALVFPHPQYRQWVLKELWTRRPTQYWNGVRDWLTDLLRGGRAGLETQLSVAQGLALLTPSAFDEFVAGECLHRWASGAAGPAGQTTATLVLQCMCLDESLAAVALGVARGWARAYDPQLRSTATAAFSGALGVRFPTDAVSTLLQLNGRGDGRGAEAAFALAGLVAVLAECRQDTGAVFRPLAYRLRAQRDMLAGRLKDGILDATLTVLRARDARTGRPVCADVLVNSPEQTEKIGELWAGVLGSLPRRTRALAGLHATLRALPAVSEKPEPVAARFGAAVGAALPPDERPALRAGLASTVARTAPATPAPSPLLDIFLDAVLSTED
ncbi:hypothetical protein [Streptomyces coerulescens]|uniref:Novel STAND NTPase 3 domain-containing protein n=1 Tax=Streptomyces coerulescens TaxID=29304 RepID=A0ABW0CI87_STRCD